MLVKLGFLFECKCNLSSSLLFNEVEFGDVIRRY